MLVLSVVDFREFIDEVADVFVPGVVDMLIVLEESCTVGFLVSGVVIPVEKTDDGVPVETIFDRSLGMLEVIGELWTRDVAFDGICMLVDDTVVVVAFIACVVMLLQFLSQQNVLIS